jgi:CubicO group peptidase (beta-lactamase class C family)
MKVIPIFALSLILLACTTQGPPSEGEEASVLPVADPETYGLDAEEIAAIEAHMNWVMDSALVSGGVALVAKNDNIIYHKAFGYSDRAKTQTMKKDDIFRWASMTKTVTTTAVMQLVEQGKINVQDPLSKYIPEFADVEVLDTWDESDSSYTTVPAEREITIHHLLTHTSGIPYAVFDPVAGMIYPQFGFYEAWTTDSVTLEENIPKQAQAPLMHQPGEKWTYGTNIDVLGYIVELVSGMPLDEYFEKNIFEPLNMEDAAFYLPEEKADRLVEVWYTEDVNADDMEGFLDPDYPIKGAKTYFPGGAGLVGTAMDYLKFASALLNKGVLGDTRILQESTVDMMLTNQIDTLRLGFPNEGFGYGGLVLLEEDEDGRNVGFWGWDGFWQTRCRLDPQNDMVIILMTNAFSNPKWNEVMGGYDKLVVQAIEN